MEHQALAKMPKFVPIMNQRSLFLRHVAQTSPAPLALSFVKAEGCILWDEEGRPFIDLISGISVCNVGHRHPRVVRAIHDQTDRYLHLLVYGELVETRRWPLPHAWHRSCLRLLTRFISPALDLRPLKVR